MKLESILILTCLSGLQCTVVVLRCHCNPAVLVAQLVEHWPRNLVVVGLSPVQDSSSVSLIKHCLLWMYCLAFYIVICTVVTD